MAQTLERIATTEGIVGKYEAGVWDSNATGNYRVLHYAYSTYSFTLDTPASSVSIYLPYSVISSANTYRYRIDTDASNVFVNSSNQTGSFRSAKGNYSSSGGGESFNHTSITLNPNINLDAFTTYYFHLSYGSGNIGALYVRTDSSSISVTEERKYSIKFNPNTQDAATVPSAITKYHNISTTLPSDLPTRTGYTFMGWCADSSGNGNIYQPGQTFIENTDVTLFAQWRINTLTIKIHVNGGQKSSEATSSMTIQDNIALFQGQSQVVNYGNKVTLWHYNNPSQIKIARPGYIVSQNQEFCSNSDGTGNIYSQFQSYDISTFADITNTDQEITLYVNWKTGGIVWISNDSAWVPYQVYYSDNIKWHHVIPYISNDDDWIQYT